jgi:CBS domain-containing protein
MPRISEVMTRGVETIGPDATLQRAAQVMDELNIGALPVCDGEELVGMITDRDITVRATAAGMDPAQHCVSEVMTSQTRWCTEDQSTDEVMRQMGDVQIRRLPVVDAQRRVVGIVSLGDLATRVAQHTDEVLRDVSWPSEPDRPQPNEATRH